MDREHTGLLVDLRKNIVAVRSAIETGDIANDVFAQRLAETATLFMDDDNLARQLRDELVEAIDEPEVALKILSRIEAASAKAARS
jgi:hypothetical protein